MITSHPRLDATAPGGRTASARIIVCHLRASLARNRFRILLDPIRSRTRRFADTGPAIHVSILTDFDEGRVSELTQAKAQSLSPWNLTLTRSITVLRQPENPENTR